MNNALYRLCILFVALGLSNMVLAQESGFPGEGEERNSQAQYPEEEYSVRESGMIMPEAPGVQSTEKNTDNTSRESSTVKKITVTPAKAAASGEGTGNAETQVQNASKNEDESALSFNFLYYLIQKFKFDTVE